VGADLHQVFGLSADADDTACGLQAVAVV
jgi:hypothetical protein